MSMWMDDSNPISLFLKSEQKLLEITKLLPQMFTSSLLFMIDKNMEWSLHNIVCENLQIYFIEQGK